MIKMKNMKDASIEMINNINDHYKQYMAAMDKSLTEITNVFFENNPNVNTVYWGQYIPGFNDGDSCEFSMTDINMSHDNWEDVTGPYHAGNRDDEVEFAYKELEDFKCLTSVISNCEDHIRRAYGDNTFVRIHRGGVEREEYDCGY